MRMVELGDLVIIKGGGTPNKGVSSYWGGSIPWASVKDFKSLELSQTVDSITEEGVAKSATNVIPAGTVITPTRMAVGKAAINTVDLAINQDLKALLPKKNVDSRFLLHVILANSHNLEKQASGATVKGIKLDVLRELKVPSLSLDEQKRIAAILDQADSLRHFRRQAIEKLNNLSQSIFYEMFGDPIASNTEASLPLNEIAELINGDRSSNYPSGNDIQESGVLFLNTSNIKNGELIFSKSQFISQEKFESLTRGKLQRGDLVITLRGTIGQCALFDCEFETGFINAQMMIIRCNNKSLPRYLKEFLSFPSIQQKLKESNSGSAVPQLTAAQMKEIKVVIPSLKEQKKFVAAVDASYSLLNLQINNLVHLDELFSSLQQRAFRGEL